MKALEAAFAQFKNMRSTDTEYGLVRLSSSGAVTDSTGLALAATEKNASIEGTLASSIESVKNSIDKNLSEVQSFKFTIQANGQAIINEPADRFAQILFAQGNYANTGGLFAFFGYGDGGSRYTIINLNSGGNACEVATEGRSFVVKNKTGSNVLCRLVRFMGSPPTIG